MDFIINIFTPPLFIFSYIIFFKSIFKKNSNLENLILSFIFLNAAIFILLLLGLKLVLFIQLFFVYTLLHSIYIFFFYKNFDYIFYFKELILKNKINNYILLLFFIVYFTLALYPINDADSYAYHLAWPKKLIEDPNIFFNMSFLEFRVVGIGEITNYISLSIGSENLQSTLSLFIFFYLALKYLKNNPSLFFLTMSSPIFVKYIFHQKPFLLPALIFVYATIIILKKIEIKKINNFDIFFILSCLAYTAMTKYNFIPLCVFAFVYFCYFFFLKNKNVFFIYSIIIFFIICFPLLFSKFLYFQDPFSPFFEAIFNNDPDILKLGNLYKNWEGIAEGSSFSIINFIVPQSPFTWADTFGIVIFAPLFYKINKDRWLFIFLLFFTTTAVSYFSNFQPRWYVPVFLVMIFNCKDYSIEKNFYFSSVLKIYSLMLFSFFFTYFVVTVYQHINLGIEELKNKRVYLYSMLKEQRELKEDVYTISNGRNIFSSDKIIGFRYSDYSKNILKKIKNKKITTGLFFNNSFFNPDGSINMDNFDEEINIPRKCIDSYKVLNKKIAKRNFFSKEEYEKILYVNFKDNLIECL